MKLDEESIKWAIKHIENFNDTDLFPLPKEFHLIWSNREKFIEMVKEIELGNYKWNSSRRFIVPKGELSYRVVTQLSPLDSIMLSSIIYDIGSRIEGKRIPISDKKVFTYRYDPDSDGHLYKKESAWLGFWNTAIETVDGYTHATYLDIADFYNQIYHHTIENQLIDCGIENQIIKLIMNLLNSITQRNSRGIPIGPYSSHLLAEMSLIPIDESLQIRGYNFVRYADDYIIFTSSEQEAKAVVYEFAEILDKEQRITIQSQKTKIFEKDELIELAKEKVADQPLNNQEKEIIELIKEKTGNDPYVKTNIYSLTPDELKIISEDKLTSLLNSYLLQSEIDFVRVRWIYRRLGQIGTPNLVRFTIEYFEQLLPAVNDVCSYLLSTSDSYEGEWKEIGEEALEILNIPIIQANEYFQIAIINLFSVNLKLNHFPSLLKLYKNSSEAIRRKIILIANESKAKSWIREQKEGIGQMNEWTKRAYYLAMSNLTKEEKKFLIRSIKTNLTKEDYLEHFILNNI